ncbi:transposase family protein [Streptomyces sp. NBC_01217]|uniref:transposase family protein n=1 Tax=Streptomyces sp. NBC_01217 TaxID=2903779 RepID=UPI002E0E5823|nr:hypothetical protein OG507_05915 [Streptomyces sp. NBC_01217]
MARRLLDGILVRTRRRTGTTNRKNCSGRHTAHGLLFLALTDTRGHLIRISAANPGRSSEITTARHNKLTAHLREAGLGALAELGFVGPDEDPDDNPVIITGCNATRNHQLTYAEKEANGLLSRERAPVEHGFANLETQRFLATVRMNARHATTRLRTLLVLANTEGPEVTDDLRHAIMPTTGTSTPLPTHTSPMTCEIRWERPH